MGKRAYKILKLDMVSTFEIDDTGELCQLLKALNCGQEAQVFTITKEVLEKAKLQAKKYTTLATLVEVERELMFSDEKSLEYLCK